jgi:hypothetical protein
MTTEDRKPFVIAAGLGVCLWLAVSFVSGKREAWDSGLYWSVAYPAAMIACAWLGYRFPAGAWRWPLTLFETQLLPMAVLSGEVGSLWILGVILLAVFALPGVLAAYLAAKFRMRK